MAILVNSSLSRLLCHSLLGIAFACIVFARGEDVPLDYAKNFSITRLDSHTELTVRNLWNGSGDLTFTYALVPRGASLPELDPEAQVIRTPVKRLTILATVYLGAIQELDLYESLVGMAHLKYSNDERAIEQVRTGYTKEIAAGSALNIESLLLLESDAIFTSSLGDPQYDAHPQLQRAKQPVVVTSDYMEAHPLGRSEWIKFMAAFFNKDVEAKAIFDDIAASYESIVTLARSAEKRPTVLANAPYGGAWHVPGGASYSARAIEDAGGDYLFKDNDARGGVSIEFESVYLEGANADFWIHPGQSRSLDSLLDQDSRFAKFLPFKAGHVFNNTRRLNQAGGNDIWERGVTHPDEVLADLVAIFHPELLPDHEFTYYERLR